MEEYEDGGGQGVEQEYTFGEVSDESDAEDEFDGVAIIAAARGRGGGESMVGAFSLTSSYTNIRVPDMRRLALQAAAVNSCKRT